MGDVAELRALAQRMRGLAAQTRHAAAQMRHAQHVDFVSEAAERYRAELRREADRADVAAQQLDEAAQALMDHAQHVEFKLAKIRSIEHWFGDRLADAKREVTSSVATVSHTAADILEHAPRAPASGSPDWIEFARRWGR